MNSDMDNTIFNPFFEFNNLDYLHMIMHKYTSWNNMKLIMEHGIEYLLDPI